MIDKKKIVINALSSALQVLIVGAVYFLLYRYLVKKLGAQELGVWSLVLATSSIANLANFGITSGLLKFVAEYKANKREGELATLVTTAFLTICIFFIILIVALFFVASIVLKKVVHVHYLSLAREILPYSLLSLFINGIGGVFTSVLEGLQKNYIRNIIYSVAIFFLFFFTILLLPRFGLLGVAYAQVIQSTFILLCAVVLSFKYFWTKDFSRFKWKQATFREIMSYGLKFQVVSICQMLYEPTTKALLSKFGGLSMVGYYEMSSRLVSQVRALIVNANQVMIPVVTEAQYKDSKNLEHIYQKSFSITIIVSIPIITGIILLSPLISVYWVGQLQMEFIIFSIGLAISNLFNILCGPSYFGFLGQGLLNPLVKFHFLMAISNIVLSIIMGFFFFGYGVFMAWCISLTSISILIIIEYNRTNSFKIKLSSNLNSYKKIINIFYHS